MFRFHLLHSRFAIGLWPVTGWRLNLSLLVAVFSVSVAGFSRTCLPKARCQIRTRSHQELVQFCGDDKWIVTQDDYRPGMGPLRNWHVWDTETGVEACAFPALEKGCNNWAISPDGRLYVQFVDFRNEVEIRKLPDGNLLSQTKLRVAAGHCRLSFCPDGSLLICDYSAGLWHWDWRNDQLNCLIQKPIREVVCSGSSGLPWVCVRSGEKGKSRNDAGEPVQLLNWMTGRLVRELGVYRYWEPPRPTYPPDPPGVITTHCVLNHEPLRTNPRFSPDGRWLVLEVYGEFTPADSLFQSAGLPPIRNFGVAVDLREGRFSHLRKGKVLTVTGEEVLYDGNRCLDAVRLDGNTVSEVQKPHRSSRLLTRQVIRGQEARFHRTEEYVDACYAPFYDRLRACYDWLGDRGILEGSTQIHEVYDGLGNSIAYLNLKMPGWRSPKPNPRLKYSPSAKLAVLDFNDGSPPMILDVPWPTDWKSVLPLAMIPTAGAAILYLAIAFAFRRSSRTKPCGVTGECRNQVDFETT